MKLFANTEYWTQSTGLTLQCSLTIELAIKSEREGFWSYANSN